MVVAGSHRLVARYLEQADPADPARSRVVRNALTRAHPWLQGLSKGGTPEDRVRTLMEEGTVLFDIPVRVVELTGRPGDVVFLHPHLLHAPAVNNSSAPRLMFTGGLFQ